ncbi:hypothetical protein GLAREA_04024 [Glarea lozoyensis ATCC 20868]|uniref:Uncharacterized protein n=1 Tax=Glarea lozoyensis (strain ATCC 20868 / MF5171) TaxID=1116229 RepID=S3CXI7_GLAL2|nr:uncharacterized protein GLAREA_04024 [Glarea lozoyensis ATCC 20868]EPE31057.1 hypothetical protein GLAREA_04024 [Glarea lozoyensis ATCC 20868]
MSQTVPPEEEETLHSRSLQTSNDTVTAWLPISTPFPSALGCSTLFHGNENGIYAFDPFYKVYIAPKAPRCLPIEATFLSLAQESDLDSTTITTLGKTQVLTTTTVLGPTFVCPQAYSEVKTISLDASRTETLCCPSGFSLGFSAAWYKTQCFSSLRRSQTLTLQSYGGDYRTAKLTTLRITSDSLDIMSAFGLNGINVVASTTSSAASMTTTSTTISATSSTISSSTTMTAIPTNGKGSSLPVASIAGLAVGMFCFVLAAVAFALLWRARQKKQKYEQPPGSDNTGSPSMVLENMSPRSQSQQFPDVKTTRYELREGPLPSKRQLDENVPFEISSKPIKVKRTSGLKNGIQGLELNIRN